MRLRPVRELGAYQRVSARICHRRKEDLLALANEAGTPTHGVSRWIGERRFIIQTPGQNPADPLGTAGSSGWKQDAVLTYWGEAQVRWQQLVGQVGDWSHTLRYALLRKEHDDFCCLRGC